MSFTTHRPEVVTCPCLIASRDGQYRQERISPHGFGKKGEWICEFTRSLTIHHLVTKYSAHSYFYIWNTVTPFSRDVAPKSQPGSLEVLSGLDVAPTKRICSVFIYLLWQNYNHNKYSHSERGRRMEMSMSLILGLGKFVVRVFSVF